MKQALARSSKWFVRVNAAILFGSLVGWPVTQFTVASHEPSFVLGLSWAAIIMAAWGNLLTAAVHDDTSK